MAIMTDDLLLLQLLLLPVPLQHLLLLQMLNYLHTMAMLSCPHCTWSITEVTVLDAEGPNSGFGLALDNVTLHLGFERSAWGPYLSSETMDIYI